MLEIVYPETEYNLFLIPFDLCAELGPHKMGHKHLAAEYDSLQSENGWGEHGCVHSTLRGKLELPSGAGLWSQYSQQFSPANYSKPLCEGLKFAPRIYGHFLFNDVKGQLVESLPSILLNYRTHESYEGSVTSSSIHLVHRSALWAGPENGRYYFGSYEELILKRVGNSNLFRGERVTGSLDTPPPGKDNFRSFPSCGLLPGKTSTYEFTVTPLGAFASEIDSFFADTEFRLMLASACIRHNQNEIQLLKLDAASVAAEACNQVRPLDYNNLENASQATDLSLITDLMPSVLKTVMDPDPKRAAQLAAKGYLAYKYAIKPTVSDVRQAVDYKRNQCRRTLKEYNSGVFRSVQKNQIDENRESVVACRVSCHSTARDAIDDTIKCLDNIGLLPSLQRAWDFVPYSFVVDWAVNTSAVLQNLDFNMSRERYGIDSCTYSKKYVEKHIGAGDYEFNGCKYHFDGFTSRHYLRVVSPFLPVELHTDLRGATTSSHIMAGGALLIANL